MDLARREASTVKLPFKNSCLPQSRRTRSRTSTLCKRKWLSRETCRISAPATTKCSKTGWSTSKKKRCSMTTSFYNCPRISDSKLTLISTTMDLCGLSSLPISKKCSMMWKKTAVKLKKKAARTTIKSSSKSSHTSLALESGTSLGWSTCWSKN